MLPRFNGIQQACLEIYQLADKFDDNEKKVLCNSIARIVENRMTKTELSQFRKYSNVEAERQKED